MMKFDYSKIPEHCQKGMKRYIEHGIIPGDFLQAVICNNLVESFARADGTNILCLFDYACFLYNEIPTSAWGSEEKMMKWSEAKRTEDLPELSEDDYRNGGR